MNKILLTCILLITPCIESFANSQVYQYRDKNGTTILSPKPSKDPDLTLVKVTNFGTGTEKTSSSGGRVISNKVVNPLISKNYKELRIDPEIEKYLEYLQEGQKVQLFNVVTDNAQASYDELVEQGYKAIGFSDFSGQNVSNDDIRNQANNVRASAVSIMKSRTGITISNKFTISTEDRPKPIISNNSSNEFYDYNIIFFVKNNALTLPYNIGVEAQIIPIDKRSIYQRNTGAYIHAVLQGSKAYNANILKGDVILAINDQQVLTPEDFSRIMKESVLTKSKILNLKVLRIVNNDLKEALISFNLE